MELKDFMDLKKLQEIQDSFSDATGLAAIAVDAKGNYITEGSNFTQFCMKYTRASREGARRCTKCNNECTGTYYCHAGLMDFSSDIIVDGEKLGSMIGGQVLPEQPDEAKFREIAKELNINPDDYIEAVKMVPVRPEKSIRAAAELLGSMVNEIVNLEYITYKNKRMLSVMNEELSSSRDVISKINRRTKELKSIANKQNMLALNASIEAARSGTAGVGFAVVAKSMSTLSADSTMIYADIESSVDKVASSIKKMDEVFR